MRPTVAIAFERQGWSFSNIGKALVQRLQDEFQLDSRVHLEFVRGPCDIVAALWWGFALRLQATLKARACLPCVYDAWSWRSSGDSRKQFALTLKQATALGVANEAFREAIRSEFPTETRELEIFILEDGVDTVLFPPQAFPTKFIVGWTGNSAAVIPGAPERGKGLALIKEACKQAKVELAYLDAAEGADWPHERMHEFYREISVYVCMSEEEGTPNPVLEAMSCGKPVVSTPVGLVPKLIQSGANGWIIPREVEALAERLRILKEASPGTLSQVGALARKAAEQHDWNIKAEVWRQTFRWLLQRAALSGGRQVPIVVPQRHIQRIPAPIREPEALSSRPETLQIQDLPVPEPIPAPTQVSIGKRPREKTLLEISDIRFPRPVLPVDGIPRALLISDQPDWAFRRNMLDLAEYLRDRARFEHWMIADYQRTGFVPDMQRQDGVFSVYHRWGIDRLLPWNRTVGSLRATWFWPERPEPPGELEFQIVNQYRAFHVVTWKNFEELQERCPNVVYLTNPVNMRRHPEMTPVQGEIVCSWNGNAKHFSPDGKDVKGFHSIIRPACEAAKVKLEYAEYNIKKLSFEEMPRFYLQANVCLCMSLYEGASNSTTEAMASGQALITTDCGNHREIQESQIRELGDTGIVILPDRTREALAQAILELKKDPARVRAMGEINREEIQKRWSWDAWADRYWDFLQKAWNT
ncbi:MAG: glycosyltransferase family 4 protein [Deltaproteobacteria bacterium]|nr:glycosyltransferase family 4 protein [Deltaproteobacteria bacterium]